MIVRGVAKHGRLQKGKSVATYLHLPPGYAVAGIAGACARCCHQQGGLHSAKAVAVCRPVERMPLCTGYELLDNMIDACKLIRARSLLPRHNLLTLWVVIALFAAILLLLLLLLSLLLLPSLPLSWPLSLLPLFLL